MGDSSFLMVQASSCGLWVSTFPAPSVTCHAGKIQADIAMSFCRRTRKDTSLVQSFSSRYFAKGTLCEVLSIHYNTLVKCYGAVRAVGELNVGGGRSPV